MRFGFRRNDDSLLTSVLVDLNSSGEGGGEKQRRKKKQTWRGGRIELTPGRRREKFQLSLPSPPGTVLYTVIGVVPNLAGVVWAGFGFGFASLTGLDNSVRRLMG